MQESRQNVVNQLEKALNSAQWIDLAPTIENGMPRWPTHPPVIVSRTLTHPHDGVFCQNISMPEHAGAHVDAPAHIHENLGEKTIEKVQIDYLVRPCKVVHLERLELKAGEVAEAEHILEWEKDSGQRINSDDIVLINFGWLKANWRSDIKWPYFSMNQPGLTEEAAELFLSRNIRAIGSDTAACGMALIEGKPVLDVPPIGCWIHSRLLSRGILLIECLANLEKLPDACYFMAFPLKIRGGSGSPIRPVALVFQSQ
jgi:arylformamidase